MKTSTLNRDYSAFKKAFIFSFTAHLALFLLILLSPHLPKSPQKGMIRYVNLISFPGGGPSGGGGTVEKLAETTMPERETLRDLTTPQNLQQDKSSSLRHPVEKPKRERTPKKNKKAIIQKQQETLKKSQRSKSASEEGKGAGTGSGLRIGVGSGPGFGSEYSSQIGLSTFPFTYYLQIIISRVSSNWFTSLVDPGLAGNFQTTVYFKILRNGEISGLNIEESSGIRSLDLSAIRAVQTSSPFPPLPKEYEDEFLAIHLIFEHSK